MHLTPGQLQRTVGLSKETFRHWRQVLSALHGHKGRSATFSPGDAIALAVLRVLSDEWGIQISRLGKVSSSIFELCNQTPWVSLESGVLLVDLTDDSCKLIRTLNGLSLESTTLLCPLASVMQQLRDAFLSTEAAAIQGELPLALTTVTSKRAIGRSS